MKPDTFHYYDEQNHLDKLVKKKLVDFPPFIITFFNGIQQTTTAKTRLSYLSDYKLFFSYLIENNPCYKNYTFKDFSTEDLEKLLPEDIEEYLTYLSEYVTSDNIERKNKKTSLARKLASLKTLYSYCYGHKWITFNPAAVVKPPKDEKDKDIVSLEPTQVAELLSNMANYENTLTGKKLAFFKKTKERDIAILTLLLGTGIRVSECVNLNIENIDIKNHELLVIRKGDKKNTVFFGNEVAQALSAYLELRKKIDPLKGHEKALFLSLQKRRISVDAVEDLVPKYAISVQTLRRITPHKLRSTYATNLLDETNDLLTVSKNLGHCSTAVTQLYTKKDDKKRKELVQKFKLREN